MEPGGSVLDLPLYHPTDFTQYEFVSSKNALSASCLISDIRQSDSGGNDLVGVNYTLIQLPAPDNYKYELSIPTD